MANILLIINPRSGKNKKEIIFEKAKQIISDAGHDLTTVYTERQGHATEIAKDCTSFDRIICMGGDGTLSEVCNGLLTIPKEERPRLGYIPAGSTNDFAKGIGLPKKITKSAKIASSDLHSEIDLGSFKADDSEEKFFTYVASFGAFTKISYSTNQNIKNKLGHFAYIFEGIKSISDLENFKPFKLRVETNDTVLEQEYIFGAITNSTSLAGLVKLDKRNVHVNDGLFELLLIRKPKNFWQLTGTVGNIISKKYRYDRIIFTHTDKLILTSEVPLDFTLDGEYAGAVKHTEINVIPNALDFIRPDEVRKKPFPKKKPI
jgi:YegS/Rv2252/BmrU family lipid kinase